MVLQVARTARRRMRLARMVQVAGVGVLIGAAVGLAGLLGLRAWTDLGNGAAGWMAWMTLLLPAALGGAAGVVAALARGPGLMAAAQRLDASLNTKDVVASSLGLADDASAHDAAFVNWLHADAERAAGRLVRTAGGPAIAPVRIGAVWWGSAAVLFASGVICVWAPEGPWVGSAVAGGVVSSPRERREAAAEIAAVREAVRPKAEAANVAAGTPREADPALERAASRLDEIERELSGGRTDVPQAQSAAANATAKAAGELRERAESDRARVEDARGRLREAAAAANAAGGGGEPSALARAMERGDVEAAKAATEELAKAMGGMSPADRELVARELSRMAEAAKKREAAARALDGTGAAERPDDRAGTSGKDSSATPGKAGEQGAAPSATERMGDGVKRGEGKMPEREPPNAASGERPQVGEEKKSEPAGAPPKEQAGEPAREPSLGEALEQAAKEMREPAKPPSSGEGTKPGEAAVAGEKDTPKPESRESGDARSAEPKGGDGAADKAAPVQGGDRGNKDAAEKQGEEKGRDGKPGDREAKGEPTSGQGEPGRAAETERQGQAKGEDKGESGKPAEGTVEPAKSGDAKSPNASGAKDESSRREGETRTTPGGVRPGAGDEGPRERAKGEPGAGQSKDAAGETKAPGNEMKGGERKEGEREPGAAKDDAKQPGEVPGGKLGEGLGKKLGERFAEQALEKGTDKPGELPPLPSAETLKALRDRLGSMKDLAEKVGRNERLAKGLEEKAREMFEKASPQQREELRKMADELTKGLKPDGRGGERDDARNQQSGGDKGRGDQKRLDGGDMPGAEVPDASQRNSARPGIEDQRGGDGGRVGGGGGGTPPRGVAEPGSGGGQHNSRREATKAEAERTEMVDARGKGEGNAKTAGRDRVVAEWLGEPGGNGQAGGGGASPQAMKMLREAAASGQKAIEERTVPPRFDGVLRKYFQRLPEAVGGGAPGSTPAAPAKAGGGKAAEPK